MAAVYPALLVADAPAEPLRKQPQPQPVEGLLARLLGVGGSAMCPRRQITVVDDVHKSPSADADPERGRVQHLAQRILSGQQFRLRDNQLPDTTCADMVASIKTCPYFGQNDGGNDFFSGTLGFHLKFRDTYREHVDATLPFLKPALDVMLRPECNVYYVNVIFARPDGQAYHVDNFFTDYCGSFRPTDLVSVLYLSSEPGSGGNLVLNSKSCEDQQSGLPGADTILSSISPCPGRVVDFDGRLFHAVEGFMPGATPRVSIVVEQCKLPRRHFMQTPKCSVFCQASNKEIELV